MISFIKLLVISFCLSKLSKGISDKLPLNKITVLPKIIMECNPCSSFWISLIISHDLFISSSIWLIIYFYSLKLQNKLESFRF